MLPAASREGEEVGRLGVETSKELDRYTVPGTYSASLQSMQLLSFCYGRLVRVAGNKAGLV